MVVPPTPQVVDEPVSKENIVQINQGKYVAVPPSISYKIPRFNHTYPFMTLKVKKLYRPKNTMVSRPSMFPLVPPLREGNGPIVEKPTLTPSQIERCTRRNKNTKECRKRHHALAL